ncbi:MAG: polysaccharide pyruvyl transferase family protein [Lachnospiraceae bacterium]|nr:polysaccharide pyruvyl transferase family protein [Lachnospiraceae bacterium]
MKYGILLNKGNVNIGDDIQAFAATQFLPSFDYLVEREHIDDFVSDDGEPVGVIMNAWYMWAKWNWPPSKYIYPCFVGFHYADHQLSKQPGSPFKYEFLNGIGGQYLKDYAPIGCRDYYTLDQLQKLGIPSYFSGCITLTLPKMPERKNKGSYICLVDLDPWVEKRIKKMLANEDIEIKVVSHRRDRDMDMPWNERKKIVTNLLTLYQNARCVVTKKLHCSLPCLAMEVPVLLIKQMEDDIRFTPYYDYLHHVRTSDFMDGNFEYDFLNPPANKDDYKPCREALIQSIQTFVEQTKDLNATVEELDKTTYSPQELLQWRHDLMKVSMDQWLVKYRDLQKKYTSLQKEEKKNLALIKKMRSNSEANEKLCQEKEASEKEKTEKEADSDSQRIVKKAKRIVKKVVRMFQ